jgi:hypothetical protein
MLESLRLIVYNAPMFFIFGVLLIDLAWRAVRLGPLPFLTAHAGTLLAWTLGCGVLYLRLVTKSIEASGHMAWLPMLTVQAYLYDYPKWFVTGSAAFTLFCLLLKLTVMGARSGIEGTLVGLLLSALLLLNRTAPR